LSFDRFASRHWLALLLVCLHTLLVVAYAWIELDHAWNDMNASMLVMAGLHIVDYPIHMLLQPLFRGGDNTGSYLATLLVVGGAYWFALGTVTSYGIRTIRGIHVCRRRAANGAQPSQNA
jgi:hypothetical protein